MIHIIRFVLSFLLFSVGKASLFGGKSGVRELSARNFKDEVLYNGNVTAVLFYAPWCGYCQKIVPEWKKTANTLKGVARVVAVNCDADINKPLCAKYNIQGFPTIKVFQPAKLTDLDFKNYAADGKPLPKRRPNLISYNGPRESKPITRFIVSHLRNYAATLDSDSSLKWLAINKIPRVLMLPGKKYKARQASPLLKILSREYFGKMRFAIVPRRVDGAWNLLGLKAPDESQLIYMSDDKSPTIYKGSMKKNLVKAFLEEQYELEMQRRKRTGETVERDSAANGLEFVVEDQQPEELEHVKSQREQHSSAWDAIESARSSAFARYGKEVPSHLFPERPPLSAGASTTTTTATETAAATTSVESEDEISEAEDFEYSGSDTEPESSEDEDDQPEEEEVDDASLDNALVDLLADEIVNEGPEAISSYIASVSSEFARKSEEAAKTAGEEEPATTTSVAGPKPTTKPAQIGIQTYDMFVAKCIRSHLHCAVLVTANSTLDSDLVTLVKVIERSSAKLKKETIFDYTVIDSANDDLLNFYSALGLTKRPGLLWWDSRKEKVALYEEGWDPKEVSTWISSHYGRKLNAEQTVPPEYLYWITEAEVMAYVEKANKEKVKDEL